MDNVVFMGKVKRQYQLNGESVHDCRWDHVLREPDAEATKCLTHEFKHKACVSTVWALMLEIFDEVTDVAVAQLLAIPISKMGENLLLKGVISLAVADSA